MPDVVVVVVGQVLCALQLAMAEKNAAPDADATRRLMSRQYRDMRSASGRNQRDFVIVRDCVNLLEYVHQVLEHFARGDDDDDDDGPSAPAGL